MFYISVFTFGGGFVIVTLMKKRFVDEKQWITEEEMLDYTVLAQASPGAIAVNGAILVGWRIAGFVGMIVSVLATIMPPMIILFVVSFFYNEFASNVIAAYALKGMQAGVAAVILDVVCSLGGDIVRKKSRVSIGIMAAVFAAVFWLNMNVMIIILIVAILGISGTVIRAYSARKKGEEKA